MRNLRARAAAKQKLPLRELRITARSAFHVTRSSAGTPCYMKTSPQSKHSCPDGRLLKTYTPCGYFHFRQSYKQLKHNISFWGCQSFFLQIDLIFLLWSIHSTLWFPRSWLSPSLQSLWTSFPDILHRESASENAPGRLRD